MDAQSKLKLKKLVEIGIDLTLVLIGAFGISIFINKNFTLVLPGLIWGAIFPVLMKRIRIEKTLTPETLLVLALVMYVPFSVISYLLYTCSLTIDYLLLTASSMALFGGIFSLILDLKC
jgi:hypothetical protein